MFDPLHMFLQQNHNNFQFIQFVTTAGVEIALAVYKHSSPWFCPPQIRGTDKQINVNSQERGGKRCHIPNTLLTSTRTFHMA
jgi:hypothetical protein